MQIVTLVYLQLTGVHGRQHGQDLVHLLDLLFLVILEQQLQEQQLDMENMVKVAVMVFQLQQLLTLETILGTLESKLQLQQPTKLEKVFSLELVKDLILQVLETR